MVNGLKVWHLYGTFEFSQNGKYCANRISVLPSTLKYTSKEYGHGTFYD